MATKHRHVFLANDLAQARSAVLAALGGGTPDEDIYIVARPDIEVRRIHDRRKMADSDFIPAALRGMAGGGLLGLLAALLIVLVHGAGIVAMLLAVGIGAAVGGLGAALMGAGIQDPVRRRFQEQIDQGRILIVIDEAEDGLPRTRAALEEVGARQLPYDAPSALT